MNNITWMPLALIVTFMGGLAFFLIKHDIPIDSKIIFIIALSVLMLIFPIMRAIRQAKDQKEGMPLEDELTDLLKIRAGAQAFHYSLYLWLVIFLFNSKFTEREEMLGIGILGSAALYGLCYLFQKRKDRL